MSASLYDQNYQQMKRKIILRIFAGLIILVVLIKFSMALFFAPWVGRKIETVLNENIRDYRFEIEKIRIRLIPPGIEVKNMTFCSREGLEHDRDLNGEIASVKLKRINLVKILFKNNIDIGEVTISNSSIKGKIPFPGETGSPIVLPLNIRIGTLFVDHLNLSVKNTLNAQFYSVSEGVLKVYDLQVEKQDTLSPGIINQSDLEAAEFVSVSSDSMYTFMANGIIYSVTSNTLAVNSFSVRPNYEDYNFTSRHEFQTDRIEADLSNIFVHNFNAAGYFRSGSLMSSYIEIGRLDLHVFRDLRKEFRHVNKPAFQEMIYHYPGTIQIDSMGLINGNITYTEHAEKANEPGSISFNEIRAKIYKITNDTIYKTESGYIELKGDALLMGKGKMTILLKGRIFDSNNTFSLNGTLSDLEAKELNPILEKNAFIYATSGKLDVMSFGFTANNAEATGNMTMLYHGLQIAVKNKRTDDTTAFGQRFLSLIAKIKVLDSNPIKDKEVRVGIIYHERDPERFLFNYCFKSILSGMKSSLARNPKKSQ